jgi:hypothetical protein
MSGPVFWPTLDLESARLTLHYVAAGQIVLAFILHLMRGGKLAAIELMIDRRVTPKVLSYARVATFGFFLGSAVAIVIPGSPSWLNILISIIWLLMSGEDLVSSKGKGTSGYFFLSTGALILLGEIL